MPVLSTYQQIAQKVRDGTMGDAEALEALIAYYFDEMGYDADYAKQQANESMQVIMGTGDIPGVTTPPGWGGGGTGDKVVPGPPGTTGGTGVPITGMSAETKAKAAEWQAAIDAAITGQTQEQFGGLPSYLQMLGLGGRIGYNPAEQRKVSMYDPLNTLWNVGQQQTALNIPGHYGEQKTFADFLKGMGDFGPGQTSLYGRAAGLLKNISGAGEDEYNLLGYDPGVSESGEYEQGAGLPALQELYRQGLRTKLGYSGAQFGAGLLPRLQLAYAGKKAAGEAGLPERFVDWVKKRYPTFAF